MAFNPHYDPYYRWQYVEPQRDVTFGMQAADDYECLVLVLNRRGICDAACVAAGSECKFSQDMLVNNGYNDGRTNIWWAMYFFDQCVYSYWEVASVILGAMSVVLWMLALLPQVYVNWKRKSTDGLSTPLLMFWLFGDFMNLAGVFILKQQMFQLFLGVYFVFNDFSLVVQYFIYRSTPQPPENCSEEQLPLYYDQRDGGYQAVSHSQQPYVSRAAYGLSNKLLKHLRKHRLTISTMAFSAVALAWFFWYRQELAIDRDDIGFYMAWGGSIMAKKPKSRNILVRLISTAGTGFTYVKQRPRTAAYRLSMMKFDPRANKHVLFTEHKIK
ncbi:hypothetical protein FB645_001256 [Coemansia sp. IMI 203386]|nr:hypothetical protein FB645_001256 [Coemansia sp. IMI 203386]